MAVLTDECPLPPAQGPLVLAAEHVPPIIQHDVEVHACIRHRAASMMSFSSIYALAKGAAGAIARPSSRCSAAVAAQTCLWPACSAEAAALSSGLDISVRAQFEVFVVWWLAANPTER
eukprot:TRINITY_DN123_c0_g1_i6.p2 TRINITY_DN123_c0_g1~~TRINITY_DN123_c0_g1_i6.p2  ORF type:complete len:118 (+),score=17.66 TRINITY_DN123_c0_g1_i6:1412-1765(+)